MTLMYNPNEIHSGAMAGNRNWDEIMPGLCRDLAQQLYTVEEIARRWGLTLQDVAHLKSNRGFMSMLQAAKQEWTDAGNTKGRAQLKAQLAVEEAIADIYKLVTDPDVSASARIAAFSQLRELGRFEKAPPNEAAAAPGVGGGFSITINLGSEHQMTVSSNTVEHNEHAGENGADDACSEAGG